MSAIYAHAIRIEVFDHNPITKVRQSAKRSKTPEVLTVEELRAFLEELEGIYRVMVYVGGVTGLRVSEIIGMRWSDCDFEAWEIRLQREWVRRHETEMKTEANRKPVRGAFRHPVTYLPPYRMAIYFRVIGTPEQVPRASQFNDGSHSTHAWGNEESP